MRELGIDFVPVPIQIQGISALHTDAALRLVQTATVIARRESGAHLIAWLTKSLNVLFGVETMSTLFDILKKDRNGTFQWLETVNDIEVAKARVLQLSSGSLDEFVIFRGNDLQVVATSAMQTDTKILGDLQEVPA